MAKKKQKDPVGDSVQVQGVTTDTAVNGNNLVSAAAQAMVKKRWDKTSAKQRSDIARSLNKARWGKAKKK